MPLSDREERMLLTIFEQEAENARLIEKRWVLEPNKEDRDEQDELDSERDFARGAAHGWSAAVGTLKRVLDA